MTGLLVLAMLAALCGLGLGYAAIRFRVKGDPVVDRIEALLPQTQCAQCNYPGCRPYAEAIARSEADINRCPPGGDALIKALAELLGCEARPLDPSLGAHKPKAVALIREAECIGCALCLKACPVDAIVGAPHKMHTVIAAECTGCELCLPPCPVDCIDLVTAPPTPNNWRWPPPAPRPGEVSAAVER